VKDLLSGALTRKQGLHFAQDDKGETGCDLSGQQAAG
jgi:hypothetical protein